MSTPNTIPEGYRENAHGHLVPEASIKEIDLLRDQTVRELFARAEAVNVTLAELRHLAFAEIQAFAQLSAEKYNVKIGGKKGNLTLVSFDGRYKIQRAISDVMVFDERLQAAKALVDECLTEWSKDAGPEIRTLINDAFQVDKEGNIDTGRVLQLRRLNFEHPRWLEAMKAIGESLRLSVSRSYVRFYRRDDQGAYVAINLDLANA